MRSIFALALTGALVVAAGCAHGDGTTGPDVVIAPAGRNGNGKRNSAAPDARTAEAAASRRGEAGTRSAAGGASTSRKTGPRPAARSQIPAPVDVAAPPKGAIRTASGLAYKVLEQGTGAAHPDASDIVTVNYTGWTTDGNMIESTVARGRPVRFKLSHVIPGWTEAVQLMTVGEKARFWIPQKLAYNGRPGMPKGMLVFDIELLHVTKMPTTPKDVAAPPKGAQKTKAGVYYVVLNKGTGTEHPTATSVVEVSYTGWTTDGRMFDSTVTRGRPARFPLNEVIRGWADAVETMTVGEKARFWIPQQLAYKGRAGAPKGMLVFDVELLSIHSGPTPRRSPGPPR